jgi:hypothetical protein
MPPQRPTRERRSERDLASVWIMREPETGSPDVPRDSPDMPRVSPDMPRDRRDAIEADGDVVGESWRHEAVEKPDSAEVDTGV